MSVCERSGVTHHEGFQGSCRGGRDGEASAPYFMRAHDPAAGCPFPSDAFMCIAGGLPGAHLRTAHSEWLSMAGVGPWLDSCQCRHKVASRQLRIALATNRASAQHKLVYKPAVIHVTGFPPPSPSLGYAFTPKIIMNVIPPPPHLISRPAPHLPPRSSPPRHPLLISLPSSPAPHSSGGAGGPLQRLHLGAAGGRTARQRPGAAGGGEDVRKGGRGGGLEGSVFWGGSVCVSCGSG